MGSIIERIYDDLEDYLSLCERLGIQPRNSNGFHAMYDHSNEIYGKLGTKNVYDFNKKYTDLIEEGWSKEQITDFFNIK